jgi:hypothetical protein
MVLATYVSEGVNRFKKCALRFGFEFRIAFELIQLDTKIDGSPLPEEKAAPSGPMGISTFDTTSEPDGAVTAVLLFGGLFTTYQW